MDVSDISIRRIESFAFVVTLLFVAGIGFAQDAPTVSPPLTIRAGTVLTVRINEPLSSDHNQVGDVFSATLTQPIIAQGIVMARYGQTAAGQVIEAKKAGRVSGVSRLGITLTNLTLVDGQNVPIQSQLLVRKGPTSEERDATAVAGTTGFGAAIGAAADWGTGAAIGAGAGAAAGVIGVLLTRGYPTVIEPETLLTFQVTSPVTVKTNDAPQAFRFVEPADYPPQTQSQPAPVYVAPPAHPYPYYVYYSPPYYPYYPYSYYPYYPYYGYPYFYGPSFSFFFGYPGYCHYYGFHGYWGHSGYVYAPRPVPYRGGIIANTFHGSGHR
jgi:hypothetical protein